MLKFEEVKFAVVYFETDQTFTILRINDFKFTKCDYEEFLMSETNMFHVEATYNFEKYDGIIVQLGQNAEDLEVTEDRCIDLMQQKKKRIADIVIRIPKFYTGKRMAYEPLNVINTSLSESETLPVIKNSKPHNRILSELPPMPQLQIPNNTDFEIPNITSNELRSPVCSQKHDEKRFRKFVIEKLNIIVTSLNHVMKTQDEIRNTHNVIMDSIISDRRHISNPSLSNLRASLPICDVKRMDEFEEKLALDEELSASMVTLLSSVGGADVSKFTFRCVRRIFSNEMVCGLNWDGSSGCHKFPKKIFQLIFYAVNCGMVHGIRSCKNGKKMLQGNEG